MIMKRIYIVLLCFLVTTVFSQTNISLSDPALLTILKADHDPTKYAATVPIDQHDRIICEINTSVNADTLHHYLEVLASFNTRHTFSDTLSSATGIGAARRWIHSKFKSYSKRVENRLQPGYLKFDVTSNTCGTLFDTRNVVAVLPGRDTSRKDIILIEAHMDSRCESRCDTSCVAHGIDDNGSGTALVLEMARVMSPYTFDRTIVFMTTTGEEQGLLGGDAMAEFAQTNNLQIRAVLNNDIVGGVICGETSSPPGCSPPGSIDSLTLRIYANPVSYLFPHQSFARSVKMFYEEKLSPVASVPMTLNVMGQEDRTGRGGDHIPFRQRGFRNLRFTSANEHGHGAPDASYEDRQHTSEDILGVDTDGDMKIDSFFVDFNYLARNTVINANAAVLLALGPEIPEFTLHNEPTGLRVEVTASDPGMIEYRVGIRDGNQTHFDDLYSFTGNSFLIPGQTSGQFYYASVAAIDSSGIMSPFSTEDRSFTQASTPAGTPATLKYGINCNSFGAHDYGYERPYPNILFHGTNPNPFREDMEFVIQVFEPVISKDVKIIVSTQSGVQVSEIPLELELGENVIPYHYTGKPQVLIASLRIDDQTIASRKLIAR